MLKYLDLGMEGKQQDEEIKVIFDNLFLVFPFFYNKHILPSMGVFLIVPMKEYVCQTCWCLMDIERLEKIIKG